MAKRRGRGREGGKRTLTKDLCQDLAVRSRADNWCPRAHTHDDAFA